MLSLVISRLPHYELPLKSLMSGACPGHHSPQHGPVNTCNFGCPFLPQVVLEIMGLSFLFRRRLFIENTVYEVDNSHI